LLVALAVPLRLVEDLPEPWRRICDDLDVLVDEELPAIEALANIVVEPRVVVRLEEPLVTVERSADVVITEDVVRVLVEEYETYDPVGVTSDVPERIMTSLLELEEDFALATIAKMPYGRRREYNILMLISCRPRSHPHQFFFNTNAKCRKVVIE
jgi:hypothetical protein